MAPNHGNYRMTPATGPMVRTARDGTRLKLGRDAWSQSVSVDLRQCAAPFPVHLERVASPLDVDTAYNFGAEVEYDNASRGHPIAGAIGGVLGYHLVRAAMRRKGR